MVKSMVARFSWLTVYRSTTRLLCRLQGRCVSCSGYYKWRRRLALGAAAASSDNWRLCSNRRLEMTDIMASYRNNSRQPEFTVDCVGYGDSMISW